MTDYNFLNLSPPEFENLCRDLLQKELGVYIESFTQGKDGGIDLRFAKAGKGNIVQCKRYKDYKSVFVNLKKEVTKVRKLNPQCYKICISVGLTPNQKSHIKKLFEPYIQDESSIYGKDDLNNLLGKYSDVELNHYKLWLSSSNVLKKIIHSKVYNQSQFEEDNIIELMKIYVQNESYFECLKALKEHHYVIISGIPGIGKTTLGRVLVYHLLATGFDEFIYLSDSVNDAYSSYSEGKKQVFLFDDFLGKNFLESNITTNEEQKILKLIDKIRKSDSKALIFTTREYILNQAKIRFELFNNMQFEISKCIIDLSKYTRLVRAHILYNHLYFSDLPDLYISSLVDSKICTKIVDHKNYNPRIIEAIIHQRAWSKIKPEEFPNLIEQFFNYPNSVWEHSYENQITELSRCVLAILCTTGSPILYDDLLSATNSFSAAFSTKYNIRCNQIDFDKSIRELEGTFIISNKDASGVIAIDYQNPSIQDFLINYFNKKTDILKDLLESAIFFNQLTRNISFYEDIVVNNKNVKRTNRIFITGNLIDFYISKVVRDFEVLRSSSIYKSNQNYQRNNNSFVWRRYQYSDFIKLNKLKNEIILDEHISFKNFIRNEFNTLLNKEISIGDSESIDAINSLLYDFKEQVEIPPFEILKKISSQIYFYQELHAFSVLSEIFPNEYKYFIENDEEFTNIVAGVAQNELDNVDDEYLEDALNNLWTIENTFLFDTTYEQDQLNIKIAEKKLRDEEFENHNSWDDDEYRFQRNEERNERDQISDLFNTLLEK